MKTYVQFAIDGDEISIKDILSMDKWPEDESCKVLITPTPGDPFYSTLVLRAPKFIHLFVRGLFEHEKQLERLHKDFKISTDMHIELVIQNSTRLHEVLVQNKTEFELFTPIDMFRSIIRKRSCGDSNGYQDNPKVPTLTVLVWDKNMPETTREASERFFLMQAQGYRPLKRQVSPVKFIPLNDFPVDDEEVVMARPRQKPKPNSPRNFPLEPLSVIFKRFKSAIPLQGRKVVFFV